MIIKRGISLARFSFVIPKYKPQEIARPIPFQLPPRPKLDPNDPYEKYEIVQPPQFLFRDQQEEKFEKRFYPGTQYLAVYKNGKTYHLFDASRIPYGKMCVRIAKYLSGKHKPTYKNSEQTINGSDICVIVNATEMYFTGKKINQKTMTYHTGYVGSLRKVKYRDLVLQKPEQLVSWTVSKMLPKVKDRLEKLKDIHVFRDREHTFTDVLPQILPHRVEFEYHGNLHDDFQKEGGTVLYSSNPVDSEQFKKDVGHMKVDLIDLETEDVDPIFKPFSMRNTKLKTNVSQKDYFKMIRRRLKVMKRYRKYFAEPYKMKPRETDYTKSYLVTSKKQLKQLKFKAPQDDEPEIDDEVIL